MIQTHNRHESPANVAFGWRLSQEEPMRMLVQARPSHPIPQEMLGPLMEMFKQWREAYRA